MPDSQRALIIGAGIAGTAAALALQRAGIDATVLEASNQPRDDEGAFVNLAPNGLNVLHALGGDDPVRVNVGFRNDRIVFHAGSGRVLADVPLGGVTLLRGGLCRLLRNAAIDAGALFQFGRRLASVDSDPAGVHVRCADNSTATGLFLLAADGIRSTVRPVVSPDAPKPTYTGIVNLGGIVRTGLASTGNVMHMIFGRHGFFGYVVRPSGDTYWFSNVAQTEEPEWDRHMTVRAAILRHQLLALHRHDPPEVAQILEAIRGEIGAYPVHDMPSLRAWHRGRICLIGDAAHAVGPHVGQGASLALEDAFIVAKCLRDLPTPEAAFCAFEDLHRERVERVVAQTRRIGRQKAPASRLGRKIRDLILPALLRKSARATEWMYDYRIDWDEPIRAPGIVPAGTRDRAPLDVSPGSRSPADDRTPASAARPSPRERANAARH